MAQIKLTVSTGLKSSIGKSAKKIGIKTTQYILNLIITDLKKQEASNIRREAPERAATDGLHWVT